MTEAWITFAPLDVMLFRDGRPFSAGDSSFARTRFPRPRTLVGAVHRALGQRPAWIAGPLLTLDDQLYFPVPADVQKPERRGTRRLELRDLPPGVTSDLGQEYRLLPVGSRESADGWWSRDTMSRYLRGEDDLPPPRPATDFYRAERRVGLVTSVPAARREPGYVYSAEFLRLRERAAFAVHAADPIDVRERVVPLGGESRTAQVSRREHSLELPEKPNGFEDGRLVLYLATPAIFTDGWRPCVQGATLVSGCVTGPEPVSGWSRNSPQPLEWAVGAGSVYFLRFRDSDSATTFANRWHGKCLSQKHGWARTAGFGLCLTGTWMMEGGSI